MSSMTAWKSDVKHVCGPYRWHGPYGDGDRSFGYWVSVEPRHVTVGEVRLIAGELFYASIIRRRRFGLRYEVVWHRLEAPLSVGKAPEPAHVG